MYCKNSGKKNEYDFIFSANKEELLAWYAARNEELAASRAASRAARKEERRARYASDIPKGFAYYAKLLKTPEARREFFNRDRRRGQTIKAGKNYCWADVLELFGNKCAFCGTPDGKRHFYTDKNGNDVYRAILEQAHDVPYRGGGKYEAGNIFPLCTACNVAMRDRTLAEWFERGNISPETYHAIKANLETERGWN